VDEKPEGTGESKHPVPAPVTENLLAPEIYADGAAFYSTKHGNISITLTSLRFDNDQTPAVQKQVVVGRIVMPPHGAHGLALDLFGFMRQQGYELALPGAAGKSHE
jgi:hypothetical protein